VAEDEVENLTDAQVAGQAKAGDRQEGEKAPAAEATAGHPGLGRPCTASIVRRS
jgi:hypothetical protein